MADWNQANMLYMPPQVSVAEMTGNMPCLLDIWNGRNATEFVALLQKYDIPSHPYSVHDCIQSLVQESGLLAEPSHTGSHLSISDLMIVILGKQ